MTQHLFADPITAINNIQLIAINLLAIAGAFIVGGQFTRIAVKFICQWSVRRQPPKPVMMILKHSGGALFAILVALLVFGSGLGIGIGSGTGDGPGNSENKADPNKTQNVAPLIEIPTKEPIPPTVVKKIDELPPVEQRERVIVLGGRDERERYYRIEGRQDRISFPELTRHLRERQQEKERPIRGVTILVYMNSPALEHQLVRQLVDWSKNEKLTIDFPPVQNERIPD